MDKMGFERILFMVLILIFCSVITSAVCEIKPKSGCNTNNIILELSGVSNAHASLVGKNYYDNVLCCTESIGSSCNGGSGVLKLSSETNSHAEVPGGNYPYQVCSQGLICNSYNADLGKSCDEISSAMENGNTIEMMSLSSATNAHIGNYSDYSIKICCRLVQTSCPAPNGIFVYPNVNSPTTRDYIISENIAFSAVNSYALSCVNNVPTTIGENSLTYKWKIGTTEIGTTKEFQKSLGLGKYEVVLNASYIAKSDIVRRNFSVIACNNNAIRESGERCDGTDFGLTNGSKLCIDYDSQFESGNLRCNSDCTLDTSQCFFSTIPTICEDVDKNSCDNFPAGYNLEISTGLCPKITKAVGCQWDNSTLKCNTLTEIKPLNSEDSNCKDVVAQYCEYSVKEPVPTCKEGIKSVSVQYELKKGTDECKPGYTKDISCDVNLVPFFGLFNLISVLMVLIIYYLVIIKKKN